MQSAAVTRSLIITADDTTGALESAAAAADAGWPAAVVPYGRFEQYARDSTAGGSKVTACIVDLRSRHATAQQAASRIRAVLATAVVSAHKIDSTLRGNWVAEVTAATATGRRVLMVPSYPAAGRVCTAGVVTEHGVPVDRTEHGDDPRSPVQTSRPASLLDRAEELASPAAVAAWLQGAGGCAVADAVDDHQLRAVVELACVHENVLLVGTAAAMGAVAEFTGSWRSGSSPPRPSQPSQPPLPPRHAHRPIGGPVLVVCGSLHPVSRVQIQALIEAGAVSANDPVERLQAAAVVVLASPLDRRSGSAQVAAQLATVAADMIRSLHPSTVVLIGGDTAEACIGERTVHVAGGLDVGVALGTMQIHGDTLALVTKPGAFGSANTLVDLMSDALTERPRP